MKTSKGVKKINFYYKIMPTAQKTVFLFASMYVIWLKAIRNWQYFRVAIFTCVFNLKEKSAESAEIST